MARHEVIESCEVVQWGGVRGWTEGDPERSYLSIPPKDRLGSCTRRKSSPDRAKSEATLVTIASVWWLRISRCTESVPSSSEVFLIFEITNLRTVRAR